jgi:hypothetical protein
VTTREGEGALRRPAREDVERWLNYTLIVGPVVLALVRILAVARFDEQRLKVLLRTLDITAVVVSTVVPVLPLVAGFVVALTLRKLSDSPKWRLWHVMVAGGLLVVATGLAVPMAYTLVLLFVFGVELWRRSDRGGRRRVVQRRVGVVVAVLTMVALASLSFSGASRMWLPMEVVHTTHGVETGFVLEAADHDLTLMRRDGGRIVIMRQNEVERRTLCRLEESWWDSPRSPWRLVNDRSFEQLFTGDLESSGLLPSCRDVS